MSLPAASRAVYRNWGMTKRLWGKKQESQALRLAFLSQRTRAGVYFDVRRRLIKNAVALAKASSAEDGSGTASAKCEAPVSAEMPPGKVPTTTWAPGRSAAELLARVRSERSMVVFWGTGSSTGNAQSGSAAIST